MFRFAVRTLIQTTERKCNNIKFMSFVFEATDFSVGVAQSLVQYYCNSRLLKGQGHITVNKPVISSIYIVAHTWPL